MVRLGSLENCKETRLTFFLGPRKFSFYYELFNTILSTLLPDVESRGALIEQRCMVGEGPPHRGPLGMAEERLLQEGEGRAKFWDQGHSVMEGYWLITGASWQGEGEQGCLMSAGQGDEQLKGQIL